MEHVRLNHRTSTRLEWLFSRSDRIALSGEPIPITAPAGFRPRNTIRTGFSLYCTWAGSQRRTALAATKPRDPRPLGRGLAAHDGLLG